MKCNEEIIHYMHEYLDEEISAEHESELRTHIQKCETCAEHFHELKKAIALVQSTSHFQAPSNFTANVMAMLPKEKKKVGMQRWFRHHPMLTAASLFIVLMAGSLFSSWNQDQQLSVSKQPNLVVDNDTVIVPKGEVVKGDVTVKNGNLKIDGEVEGNVTVINGEINGENYLASAGQVTGDIEEINAMFEWLWYHIKTTAKGVVSVFDQDTQEDNK
ncbi:anti-sigma factor family protein [Cytobacillus purgationiresistens]|uniref:Anti-sigma-W factor RsiW n=1 Tax=Cytobacillus purgationiresistens TaxID=863449 RepID=A0ABU0AHC1_9BACI|nr:anti-sigma factor [Cytobacillus purgationiresistens]MDQ0270659.1 anti-sigma factor RsiW [Cytobacillus purgationiresistens]